MQTPKYQQKEDNNTKRFGKPRQRGNSQKISAKMKNERGKNHFDTSDKGQRGGKNGRNGSDKESKQAGKTGSILNMHTTTDQKQTETNETERRQAQFQEQEKKAIIKPDNCPAVEILKVSSTRLGQNKY